MTVLNIGGKRVKVDDSFKALPLDQQNATVDEIAKSIGLGAPKAETPPAVSPAPQVAPVPTPEPAPDPQPAPAESKAYKGAVLPISVDEQGNNHFDSDAGLLGAVKRAFMLPGDVMAGKVDPTSQEGIERATDFAGVFGPMSPAAGTGKAIAASAPKVARPGMEAAQAAERIGVDLPRAVASDSAAVNQGGRILTNVPIGGTPLRTASKEAIEQIGNAATRVQEGYGSGSIPAAGAAARQGITDYAKKTLPGRVKEAYDNVDTLVTQNVTTPLAETTKIATEIAGRRANAKLPESGAVKVVQDALAQKDGLNYQGIKDLRTNVRELLDNPQNLTASGFSQTELDNIYKGLTADLKNAVARSGGEKASAAFEEANKLAARTARERQGLQKVLGSDASDERIFDRITAMAGSTARADRVSMSRVRGAVSADTWNELASGVIAKLGRDPEGNFSPDRFVTGWGKLSKEGKSQLFGGKSELATALDDIATVSSQFKRLNQYANPSGTAQSGAGIGYLGGMFVDPTTVVGSIVGARVMSSIMAKPVSARALAAYSKAYEQQAAKPTPQSSKALANTARALAAFIGHETGDTSAAVQIFPAISNVRKLPADQGGENNGMPEGQNGGVEQQPRVLLPNET